MTWLLVLQWPFEEVGVCKSSLADLIYSLDLWLLSTLFTSSLSDGRISDQYRATAVEVL